jgi:hypothetical protein
VPLDRLDRNVLALEYPVSFRPWRNATLSIPASRCTGTRLPRTGVHGNGLHLAGGPTSLTFFAARAAGCAPVQSSGDGARCPHVGKADCLPVLLWSAGRVSGLPRAWEAAPAVADRPVTKALRTRKAPLMTVATTSAECERVFTRGGRAPGPAQVPGTLQHWTLAAGMQGSSFRPFLVATPLKQRSAQAP